MAVDQKQITRSGFPRKYMPVADFISEGYLQEVNRMLLHPLGVALVVQRTLEPVTWLGLNDTSVGVLRMAEGNRPDTSELIRLIDEAERREAGDAFISGVWDERDDPEGIYFAPPLPLRAKALRIRQLSEAHSAARIKLLGSTIQEVADA